MEEKIRRLLVFGDIHGMWYKFKNVYSKVQFDPETDMIVFLGDYLDRGSQPVPVMEWVLSHYGNKNMIFLRGNHEQMFYEAMTTHMTKDNIAEVLEKSPKGVWYRNGGRETLMGLKESGKVEKLTSEWLKLIEKLPCYHEVETNGKKYWFVHGDCTPDVPLKAQNPEQLLWERKLVLYPRRHKGEQVIVVGHTPVQAIGFRPYPQWLQDDKLVLMDTGSFMNNGRISCADLISKKVYQSDWSVNAMTD